MMDLDRTLLNEQGLAERGTWYRNMVYAPGRFTGYGSKTFPGVREPLEEGRWADAAHYIGIIAGVLNAYGAQLDKATQILMGR